MREDKVAEKCGLELAQRKIEMEQRIFKVMEAEFADFFNDTGVEVVGLHAEFEDWYHVAMGPGFSFSGIRTELKI